jgi:hypothetical protein
VYIIDIELTKTKSWGTKNCKGKIFEIKIYEIFYKEFFFGEAKRNLYTTRKQAFCGGQGPSLTAQSRR